MADVASLETEVKEFKLQVCQSEELHDTRLNF